MQSILHPLYLDKRNAQLEPSGTGRHSGIHLSAVVDHLAIAMGKKYRNPDQPMTAEDEERMASFVEMGFMWETIIDQVFKVRMLGRRSSNVVVQLQGLELDGIFGTPDALDVDGWLEEYKATWRSAKGWDLEGGGINTQQCFDWLIRIQGYLKMVGLTKCRLFVFFVNGYYTRPYRPRPMRWDLYFTQDEIDANWQMIVNHKHLATPECWEEKVAQTMEDAAKTHSGQIETLFGAEFDRSLAALEEGVD